MVATLCRLRNLTFTDWHLGMNLLSIIAWAYSSIDARFRERVLPPLSVTLLLLRFPIVVSKLLHACDPGLNAYRSMYSFLFLMLLLPRIITTLSATPRALFFRVIEPPLIPWSYIPNDVTLNISGVVGTVLWIGLLYYRSYEWSPIIVSWCSWGTSNLRAPPRLLPLL